MPSILLIGEDAACCALGRRLVADVLGWTLRAEPVNTRGVTELRKGIPRYLGVAAKLHVLCIADADRACGPSARAALLPRDPPPGFLLRLAVPSAESWIVADRERFARHFGVKVASLPRSPDAAVDVKRQLVAALKGSTRRDVRNGMVSWDARAPGVDYNAMLCEFVGGAWDPLAATAASPSLGRAVARLRELAALPPPTGP